MNSVFSIFLATLTLASVALGQTARDQVRLDDAGASGSFRPYDMAMQGDGMLRVAMWVDHRDSDERDAIRCAVSLDRGVTFGPEVSVYDQRSVFINVDHPRLAVANGVIYVSFDDDRAGASTPTTVLMRSDDLGATWSQTALGSDLDNPELYVDGDNVLLLVDDESAGQHILTAFTSNDQGQTFHTGAPLSGGNVATAGWSGIVDGNDAYAIWFDDGVVAGDNFLYLSKSIAGSPWSSPVRIDQDSSGFQDADSLPSIAIGGGNIYVSYLDDERNGGSYAKDLATFCVSRDGGTTWAQSSVSSIDQDADYLMLAAEDNTVAITWSDYTNGAYDSANVVVSTDGGATFTSQYTVPSAGDVGLDDHRNMNVFVEGSRIVLSFASTAYTVGNIEWPAFCYSIDAGANWQGPFVAGNDLAADEDIDTQGSGWIFADGSLSGLWRADGDRAMFAGGIRLPFIEATVNLNQTVTFKLAGVSTDFAGIGYARWAASTTTGNYPHPENSLEVLGLGFSPALQFTLARPRVFSALIDATGFASFTLPVGPRTGNFFVQGWLNSNATTSGGGTTSDLIEVVL